MMASGNPIVRLDEVSFGYPGGPRILDTFSWSVAPGESWAVIGPSGCGKTTLLYLLAGLRQPDEGHVEMDGSPITGPRHEMGLILQDHGLLPWGTALDNVGLGLRLRGAGRTAVRATAAEWLRRLGLKGLENRYPAQLSGGQRQRVAIARTLALSPALLLMDEPFSALDALTRETLQVLALELGIARGLSSVLVTHDIQEAVYLGSRILVMGETAHDPPAVIENPAAGDPAYSGDTAFLNKVREVRGHMKTTPTPPVPSS